jgi:exodeoxyribonuclease-1
LAEDPAELFMLNAEAIRLRLFTRAEDLPEGLRRLPIKTIHINKSPIVIGNLKTLTPAVAARWGVDLDAALRHAEVAARRGASLGGLWDEVFARPAGQDAPDVDEDLYGGFIGNADRRTLERLRTLPPAELADRHPAFEDGRLDELLFRYRARNHPATLSAEEAAQWRSHCAERLHAGAGGALTLAAFFERIDQLGDGLAEDDERGQAILGALYDYAEQIAPDAP